MQDRQEALERQNAFYETIRAELESESFGKWAGVSREKLVGVYDTNGEASEVVLKLAPRQTCLVQRIGYVFEVSPFPFLVKHVPITRLSAAE